MKIYKSYKIKSIFKLFIFVITLFLLLFLSKENFNTVKKSVNIFFSNVVPSLLPFILFTEIILKTDIIFLLTKIFGNLISKIFKVNKNSASSVIIGFLCGFPMGSKSVNTLYENKKINKSDANILLTFVNNCNPAFLISTIGIGIFNDIKIGFILLISHVLSSIIIGLIYSRKHLFSLDNIIHKNNENCKRIKNYNINNLNRGKNKININQNFFIVIRNSILNSFVTLGNILGFIIIFNLLSNIINIFLEKIGISNYITTFIYGLFEITNGCNEIYSLQMDYKIKICIISFILGFSGICILCQVFSTICEQNFKFLDLVKSKFLHGILSFILTYIILKFVNLEVIHVFKNVEIANAELAYYINNMTIAYLISTFAIFLIIFIYYVYVKIKTIK